MSDIGNTPRRRWRDINYIADNSAGTFTRASVRALVQRSKPHFNTKGEWVKGNGLAQHISQPGGKGGKVLIDELGWDVWLESWCKASEAA